MVGQPEGGDQEQGPDKVGRIFLLLVRANAYRVAKQSQYKRAYAKSKTAAGRQILSDILGSLVKVFNFVPKLGFQGIIMLATVAYCFVSIGQWIAISHQLKQSRIEMTIANRPWIEIETQAANFISFDDTGVHGIILMQFKNVGHSPALHGRLNDDSFIPKEGVDIIKRQTATCSKAGALKSSPFDTFGGYTITSSDVPGGYPMRINIKKAEVDEALRKFPPGMHGIFLYVVGCLNYKIPWQAEDHTASVAFEIDKDDPSSPDGWSHFTGRENGKVAIRILINPAFVLAQT